MKRTTDRILHRRRCPVDWKSWKQNCFLSMPITFREYFQTQLRLKSIASIEASVTHQHRSWWQLGKNWPVNVSFSFPMTVGQYYFTKACYLRGLSFNRSICYFRAAQTQWKREQSCALASVLWIIVDYKWNEGDGQTCDDPLSIINPLLPGVQSTSKLICSLRMYSCCIKSVYSTSHV